jgi:hypothetical protein
MAKQSRTLDKVSDRTFRQMWITARKDPNFIKEMKAFVKASTAVYKLD